MLRSSKICDTYLYGILREEWMEQRVKLSFLLRHIKIIDKRKRPMQSKISLGTVQFGLRYGIANRKGKIPPKEVFEILKYAADSGINCLDTAFAYGDSEDVIGAYLRRYPHQFQVVSKLPSLDVYSLGKAEECLRVTLGRLNIKKLSGYLIHSFEDFLVYEDLWGSLSVLKSKVLSTRSAFHCIRRMILRFCLRKISRLISSRFPTVSLTADSRNILTF